MSQPKILAILSSPPPKSASWLEAIGIGQILSTVQNVEDCKGMLEKNAQANGFVSTFSFYK